VFNVVVAADRQPDAAFQAPALEHLSAICAGHALAKAMHAHAPPDPGLIWTFCCHALTSKIIIKTPNSGLSAGVFAPVPVFYGIVPILHGISPGSSTGWGRVAIITEGGDSVKLLLLFSAD
jgi:hypothetical protein